MEVEVEVCVNVRVGVLEFVCARFACDRLRMPSAVQGLQTT